MEAIGASESVAIATGTASGKSLCFVVPVVDAALKRPDSRALMLFPTKALAQDQLASLGGWDRVLADVDVKAATYDGDTPQHARTEIRRSARIVLTNPDMLHTGILPHHPNWSEFFRGLEMVVLDEMHVYRGVFGSHVANVMRRLRRIAGHYGADPTFVLTSATIANPGELGQQLTGGPVRVVDDDTSPRGKRTIAFYNPPIVDETLHIRRSPTLEADALARHFIESGVQTIVFARTRQTAELIARYVSEGLESKADRELVRGYRGGYTASERRAIERSLRGGLVRGVVATNALELGIDIGSLDACVMAGYPGTIAGTWQQAGRAGRRGAEAVAVMVAGSSPLDQFIIRHPEFVLSRSPEHARLDPDNLLILLDHMRCAAFELPFDPSEAEVPFGTQGTPLGEAAAGQTDAPPTALELLRVLEAEGGVTDSGGTWYWMADAYPAGAIGLRTVGADSVTIVTAITEAPEEQGREAMGVHGTHDVLGTVEREMASRMVHPGAVYLHDRRAYEVQALDWEQGRAEVVPADGAVYTRASSSVTVKPIEIAASRSAPGVALHHGELEVTVRATGYRRIRFRTHETVSWGKIDLPEHRHVAGSYWFTLEDDTLEELRAIGRWRHDPITSRGPDWSRQRERARQRDGYRCRLCGAEEKKGHPHDVHHIRPFREFTGGDASQHLQANALDNLITLCKSCHQAAERALGLHGGLTGVGHALSHIAPLYLMCDPRDLGVVAESHAPWTGRPTVAVYERAAAGVGFGRALYEMHELIVSACAGLVAECPCPDGCPSCIGPAGEQGADAKRHALAVLRAISS